MRGDTPDDVGEPGLRIDAVHFRGLDQRVEAGGAFTSRVRAGEQIILPAKHRSLHAAFGGVIGHLKTAIVDIPAQRGEVHDLVGADELLPDMQANVLLADKAFDADERVIKPLLAAGKKVVIPLKVNRKAPRKLDRHLYAARHLIENFFAKLKQFRAIATRYDKTARNFLAAVHLVASVIWLN